MKDLLLCVRVVVKTLNLEITRCHLADYVKELHLSACRTCSTIIFPHSTNQIIVFWCRRCCCHRPCLSSLNRELTQPWRRRQHERRKFAYLTVKNNRFARFARSFFIFGHSADVLVLSTTWNDLSQCSCEDDVSTRWQIFNFVFLSL